MNESQSPVPLSRLSAEEKSVRSGSFGEVASLYERYRPGPPVAAVDWFLPARVGRIVDLGAGTGALTRLLVDRADEVVAMEPDDRMRAVLQQEVAGVQAVKGYGESMPLPDGSVDAVLASSSWHWMDTVPALHEVARVLVPGGFLGAVWSGPDPEGAFMVQAQSMFTGGQAEPVRADDDMASLVLTDVDRPTPTLEIPDGVPFEPPAHEFFRWDVPLTADDLIGLLGTLSWFITAPEDTRTRVTVEARRLLAELLGIEGDVTIDVTFRADAWKSRCTSQ